jgi:flagellar M-ring protein FliF
MSEYWNALSARQRTGLIAGAALIAVAMLALTAWLLHDPYVAVAKDLSADTLAGISARLDAAKVEYRVGDGGDAISVPRSQAGRARAFAAANSADAPASVGLELFKETDFSSTDFAQRINYQRALQGELTRTIQTISGVHRARVHVILPDGGLFKRGTTKATAAVSITAQPGSAFTRAQVRGIQRLVAASVPEIKPDDVVVLDDSGTSLTGPIAQGEADLSSAQLELKRQADQYLEGKVLRLLQELVPRGTASVSVDTRLDEKQLRVTTEEPLAARNGESGQPTGVLVRERQAQRGRAAGIMETSGHSVDPGSTDWEYEYKVGSRIEHTLSAPGSIKRVSVAVALQGAPDQLSGAAIEDLVAHAVGMDPARGDSVMVMLLPEARANRISEPEAPLAAPPSRPVDEHSAGSGSRARNLIVLGGVLGITLLAVATGIAWRRRTIAVEASEVDIDAITAKVGAWLRGGMK